MYLQRTIEPSLLDAARQFPAVVLTGPRQSGKTTTLKRLFGETHGYVSLDEPDVRIRAMDDPRLFLNDHPPPVVLDEVQHAPDLLAYIKVWIDAHRDMKGAFIVSGSQLFALMRGVTESLAGRAAPFTLLGLSRAEKAGQPMRGAFWDTPGESRFLSLPPPDAVWQDIIDGGFPDVATGAVAPPEQFYRAYLQTYLERDVRSLRNVGDLTDFQRFLAAAAARAGQLCNLSELALDLGVSQGTVKAWCSVLEASGQICFVRQYHRNLGKRVVKRPKLFFTDTGLLSALVHLHDCGHARHGPMAGALFENAVFAEVHRYFVHRGLIPRVYYWRTATGREVDLVVEWEGRVFGIEAKATATPRREDARSMTEFRGLLGDLFCGGALACLTSEHVRLGDDIAAIHCWELC